MKERDRTMFQDLFAKLQGKKKDKVMVRKIPESSRPVLRKSICTGETTAGFKDVNTGKYTEVMLIRGEGDLEKFMSEYGLEERPETEY